MYVRLQLPRPRPHVSPIRPQQGLSRPCYRLYYQRNEGQGGDQHLPRGAEAVSDERITGVEHVRDARI